MDAFKFNESSGQVVLSGEFGISHEYTVLSSPGMFGMFT